MLENWISYMCDYIDIGHVLQQKSDHIYLTEMAGDVQWRVAGLCFRVYVCIVFDEDGSTVDLVWAHRCNGVKPFFEVEFESALCSSNNVAMSMWPS